jgi:hypothetical protein
VFDSQKKEERRELTLYLKAFFNVGTSCTIHLRKNTNTMCDAAHLATPEF